MHIRGVGARTPCRLDCHIAVGTHKAARSSEGYKFASYVSDLANVH
jgi:hypothetical protein